ncbi:transporter substrate-binding domain-containing protein (plasmid) [Agrobacterium radiobacter]|uniref:Family 3 extracellular solute-binding protein n=1 Tax=Agrobacterium tumefaciens str. B6 TaxID=1183423 RepID=A0A822V733_AGRTU|nr:transporter substrate-binding domain-containing protein [Agrobacterium tumefaciens]MQB27786.1 amino acid ABC transporter substrate-binding protein [Agrobacterium tumefaciens]NTA08440.1 transporter substrate-binding domain-containing protein [Agrobacterium tumefaciens]NTB16262.1 transporter substrate-binding domain-containing protein [Agrobacterium tumefaciens]CVI25310.1 Family 3 extracellular solute-binding protein [Agrobacterium tumefaciens str. B6]SPZ49543.1 general L-amino acid ABC trans
MKRMIMMAAALALVSGSAATTAMAQERKLDVVKSRGSLKCSGHNGSFLGFAEVDDKGQWKGLDIELCRALSAGIFGKSEGHLEIVPIDWAQRWPGLQSGDIDVVIKVSGWTQSRDTELNLSFSQPYFVGTFSVMAHKETDAKSLTDLKGGVVCAQAGSSNERILASAIKKLNVDAQVITFGKTEELRAAYYDGRCDAILEWTPSLGIWRAEGPNPQDQVFLSDTLSMEAESIVVTEADPKWLDVQNWMISSLLFAEEQGITKANIDEFKAKPTSPEIEKFLGVTPGYGKRLGLSDDWAYNMIKEVGNYAEIYDRTLGKDSAYKLERGKNALYRDGGVLYPFTID